jgi:hypothetical protein
MQAIGSLAVPILIYSLELLTGTKRKYKCWIKNKKNVNHPWTASSKSIQKTDEKD